MLNCGYKNKKYKEERTKYLKTIFRKKDSIFVPLI